MGARFQTLPTVNPSERKFKVTVDDLYLKPSNLPVKGTTYGNWNFDAKERIDDGWNSYIYLMSVESEPGTSAFLFGKDHSAEEKATPYNSFYSNEPYDWPAVLHAFGFMVDQDAVISYVSPSTGDTENVERPFVRAQFQPSVRVESKVLIEEFLSSTAWAASDLVHQQPIPGEVSWDILGSNGVYERCLHGELKFLNKLPSAVVVPGMGTENAAVVFAGGEQTFPSTNFTSWRKFVLSDTQKEVEGQYVRRKVTIFPPKGVQISLGAPT